MSDRVLRPIAEGFRGSLSLWKGIILALLSVISVISAFVNVSRNSEFNVTRSSD